MSKHLSKFKQTSVGVLTALLLTSPLAAQAVKITDYSDIGNHWATNALTWAVDNNVLVGKSENRMAPNDYLTRAQLAAMIDRLFGTYKNADLSQYADTVPGSWYYDSVSQAVNMGTFAGYGQNRMGPNDFISREQAIAALARTICLSTGNSKVLTKFPDQNNVSAWACEAVSAMVERQYVVGSDTGNLNPKGNITRAEMAQIMSGIFRSIYDSGELTGTYHDTVLIRGAANIHDVIFEGDLILANGLRDQKLGLNNVTVKGRLIVWGGSEIHINGKSEIAEVITPRNDNPVKVIFDETASALSKQSCSVVYPQTMDKNNEVKFTEKKENTEKPTIQFELPEYLYAGDSIEVKTTLTNADSVTWVLTKDGRTQASSGFTDKGGTLDCSEPGRYTLKATASNNVSIAICSKSVEVLPVGDIAFSLPEYGYIDTTADVKLLTDNGLDGIVEWSLTKDGTAHPMPEGFTKDGGTLALSEAGDYTLSATLTDAAGKQYTASRNTTVLPVINLTLNASAEKLHEDETAEISLTLEGGAPTSTRWSLTCDGEEIPVSLEDHGGTLAFADAGGYVLTVIATDSQGREFTSNPVSIQTIENLSLALTSDVDKLHEDEDAVISMTVDHGVPTSVQWSMTRNGKEVPLALENGDTALSFEGVGDYVLTAIATDELGKEFTATLPIMVYPVIDLTLEVPESIHFDQPAAVSLSGNDGSLDVVWEVNAENGTVVSHSLTNEGGEISFPAAGTYTVTASVTDELGRTFTASDTIQVWDTMQLSFRLPEFAHPDETVKVKMTSENLGQRKVEWSLTVDGQPVKLSDGIKGSLDNEGGSVKFLKVGTNILTASVTDDLGRTFTHEQTIEVYPLLSLELSSELAVHTDEQIYVSLNSNTPLPVTWKVSPSNDPSAETVYTGNLTDDGGTIQIENAGVYDITASVTDTIGRVFSAKTVSVTVYPVAGLQFTLPATAWTDSSTPIDLLTSDLQNQNVTWTLTKDGDPVSLTDNMLGDLGNDGGNVRFPAVGIYTLTASATDDLGREYTCSQTIHIYPVVGLTVSINEMSHTDTAEDVNLAAENLGKNNVVWTVLRDGIEIQPPYALNKNGGHGFFTEPGLYTFTATVTDELGRVTSATDSIQIYPVGVSGFYLPTMFHTDSTVNFVTGFEELADNPLRWELSRNGESVPTADYVTGELNADGGRLQFKQAGDYKLRAYFKDAGGRTYSHEQKFTVYPIPVVAWTLPNYAHTDNTFIVGVESQNVADVEGSAIKWYIDDTYGLRQNWGAYVAGNLTAEPGEIRIKHAGIFTLGCEVTDATGRVFSFDGASIEVLAEQELQVSITEQQVYTGETAQVRTLGNNIELPVEWSLERDGQSADITTYVIGELNNLGGAIQFAEGGTYRLIGKLTDGLGRTFVSSDTITVLPVGDLTFTMANMEYVGNHVPVVMDKLFNPDGNTIEWSVQKDGAACILDLSALDNGGGTVIFPEPGEYTLTATLRDSNGKTAIASQNITIIFKAALTVTASESVHIGSKFAVGISGAGGLDVSWGVKKGGKPVILDSNTGFLSNDGGTLSLYEEGTYTITATVRDDAGNLTSGFVNVTVTNTAPVIDSFTANATREMRDGRFFADVNATCSDPDGDEVHLEWSDEYQVDGYYSMGAHTVSVRAVDEWGAASAWETRTFAFSNNAPAITSFVVTPSRVPNGDRFPVQVSVDASDPDSDQWTLEWGGDYQESGLYSVGTWTIQVRAVDEWGAVSPWQYKTFSIDEYLSLHMTAPTSVRAGEAIPITLSGAGNYPVTWSVTAPDGSALSTDNLGSTGGTLSFPTAGSYTISASITGVSGATASDVKTVVVLRDTVFSGKFSMNLYWDNNGNDMDSHMYFYDANGAEVGHVFYGNKIDCGCSLDIDDTRGGTGEWLTVDFDGIPANVNRVNVSIYGYRGDAVVWMILKQENTIVDGLGNISTEIRQPVRLDTRVTNHQTVSFGYFQRAGDSWDFYGYDGSVVHGSGTL